MIITRENVTQTAQRIIAQRPVLEQIIKAFEGIFEARATLPMSLLPLVEQSGLRLPKFTAEHANHGQSLLSGMSLKGFDDVLTASARTMLPFLVDHEYLQQYINVLHAYFIPQDEQETHREPSPFQSYELAEAYIANDASVIEKTAESLEIPAQALLFAFHFILSPALQALVMYSVPAVKHQVTRTSSFIEEGEENTAGKACEAPWDANSLWQEGFCPVCVSFPSIAFLDRALLDENNQFLAGGGGKKYLHCSLCGTHWHFKRGCCPACKEEGPDVIEIFKESDSGYGERIDWCTKCKSYCPNIDLRALGKRPDFDMMALGMLHLDMIAAEKKLIPLTPSFWNTF